MPWPGGIMRLMVSPPYKIIAGTRDLFTHNPLPPPFPARTGVNNGMAAKGGAVSWRAGLDPAGNVSSWQRDAVLTRYHGSPSGIFLADECLAGRMPSKGSETCLVVEQLFSLNIVHEVQGDAFFADRAETSEGGFQSLFFAALLGCHLLSP